MEQVYKEDGRRRVGVEIFAFTNVGSDFTSSLSGSHMHVLQEVKGCKRLKRLA